MTPALILAGGTGRRLGGADKAFVQLTGRPLVEVLLATLRPQTEQIAISANGDLGRFAHYGLPVLVDGSQAGKGPLAGLAAGLAWAKSIGAETLLTIPVDTPFIPENLLKRLTPAPAVAVWQGRQHHLVAHWPVSMLPRLEVLLSKPGAYKVREALALCQARQIIFDEADDPFFNINTQDDFVKASSRANHLSMI